MSTLVSIIVTALVTLAIAIFLYLVFSPSREGGAAGAPPQDGISVNTAEGSIVTVRKVGRITSVTIRSTVHDHWEGSGDISVPPLPIEVTKLERPELYEEYINPKTSAMRKYEIADDLYAEGFTLPYISGLNEQYKKEVSEALISPGDGKVIAESTPARPSPTRSAAKNLVINHDVAREVTDNPVGDTPSGPEEQ